MAKAYGFRTLNTNDRAQYGTMGCTRCGKRIDSGDYGLWQNKNGHVTVHRKCNINPNLDFDLYDLERKNRIRSFKTNEADYRLVFETYGYDEAFEDAEVCKRNRESLEKQLEST
ncbi:MAG: hypothetical protein KAS32_09140 [Candidatus Peribacteraceae bacterium]|nr:hypothetical protein [Candidatus Peribacteraceae bacterium]